MKTITKDQMKEVLDRVTRWPLERQVDFVRAIELIEEQYDGERLGREDS